jgi:hypothetical protein
MMMHDILPYCIAYSLLIRVLSQTKKDSSFSFFIYEVLGSRLNTIFPAILTDSSGPIICSYNSEAFFTGPIVDMADNLPSIEAQEQLNPPSREFNSSADILQPINEGGSLTAHEMEDACS